MKPVLHDPLGQFQLSGIVQTIVKAKVPSLPHINVGFMTISPGQLALDHMVFFVPCDKCHAAFGNIGEGKRTAAQIIHQNVFSFRPPARFPDLPRNKTTAPPGRPGRPCRCAGL